MSTLSLICKHEHHADQQVRRPLLLVMSFNANAARTSWLTQLSSHVQDDQLYLELLVWDLYLVHVPEPALQVGIVGYPSPAALEQYSIC